jgi:hypothetical protein
LPSLCDASYRDICKALGYSVDGRANARVIPSAIDESPLQRDREVFVTTPLNTTEDDLEFELLLCLASTIEVIQGLQQTRANETEGSEATHVKTRTEREDQEFELLECLADTIEAIQSLLPTGAGGGGKSLERESDNVLNIKQGKWHPRSGELAWCPGSD